jgi:hypothetical protein
MRDARTAFGFVAAFASSGAVFAAGYLLIRLSAPNDPTRLVGAIVMVAGVVPFIIGSVLLWCFTTRVVHDVRITDRGISYDRKEWSWESVAAIRAGPVLPNGVAHLSVIVNRGWRGRLALPIEIKGPEPKTAIENLQAYLASSGYDVRWHSSAI